jgi:hypothetical protein
MRCGAVGSIDQQLQHYHFLRCFSNNQAIVKRRMPANEAAAGGRI